MAIGRVQPIEIPITANIEDILKKINQLKSDIGKMPMPKVDATSLAQKSKVLKKKPQKESHHKQTFEN